MIYVYYNMSTVTIFILIKVYILKKNLNNIIYNQITKYGILFY